MVTLSFDTTVLFQLLFYVAVLIFLIHAVILTYHWNAYGANVKRSRLGIAIHFIVGSILLTIMGLALLYL